MADNSDKTLKRSMINYALRDRAVISVKAEDYALAEDNIAEFMTRVIASPKDQHYFENLANAHHIYGEINEALGNLNAAERHYNSCIRLFPKANLHEKRCS